MRFVSSSVYEVDIGKHVFPTQKYRLIRELLLNDGVCSTSDFLSPKPASFEELADVHTPKFLLDMDALLHTERTRSSELPLTSEIINAYKVAAGGTTLACRTALAQPGICCHIGGGFHHAFADHAEGFCYINDIAVGIRAMLREGLIQRAAVVDLDLHQGNGTASIFGNDARVTTFSMHQQNNYPEKQRSDYDIGLPDMVDDAEYLFRLRETLPLVLDSGEPELIIYVAGADPYQKDQLGGLNLTLDGLAQRDRFVLQSAVERRIPIVSVTAGGYARDVMDTVRIQAQTCRIASEFAAGFC